ncbi:permease-like cell division protein FtsX [Catellatospora sp. NPDC049133]|jgi:cell division protein FtsX|uniref:permease-like cell division protein FtsX n=1 Tax=Catellatospora sp. NPDC049133 TaxID=3155499 RepID=UPI0033EED7F3
MLVELVAMSDSIDSPSVDSPPPAEPADPTGEPPRRRGWFLPVVVVASVLVGALVATAVIVFTGWNEPEHRYQVSVYLERDITAQQRETVQSALAGLDPVEAVRYESGEQSFQNFKDQFKDAPDLLETITADDLPGSLLADFAAPEFDCAMLEPVKELAGVDTVVVLQLPEGDGPRARVSCGNLL